MRYNPFMKTKTSKPQSVQSAPVAASAPVVFDAPAAEQLANIAGKLDDIVSIIAEGNARADKLRADFEARTEADRKIFKNLTETSAKRDRAIEDTFGVGLPDVLKPFGINLTHRQVSTRVRNANHSPEFDVVAANGKAVVVGEIKLHLTWRDVRRFLRSLKAFRDEFPKHRGKDLYGFVAGLIVDDEAADFALKSGFFILQMSGGQIYPDTPKNFRPRAY